MSVMLRSHSHRRRVLQAQAAAATMTLRATTAAPGQTVTLHRMTPVGTTITIYWGDGGSTVVAIGDTTSKSHVYASASTYTITITPASAIQQIDLHDAALSGLKSAELAASPITYFICYSLVGGATANAIDSADMAAWTPTYWHLRSMPAGTYTINSAHMSGWTPTDWRLLSMPAGTYSINSAHMSAWTPTYWRLLSMPAGTYSINSAHMSAWTPTDWRLYSMPAGTYSINSAHMSAWTPTVWYLYSITGGGAGWTLNANDFAGWTTATDVRIQDNGLLQAQVNAALWGMYQATLARTVTGGTLSVGGTNAAPSGVYQACAACPVNVATPGKEIAHELINDGCGAIAAGETWTTVTFTA